MTESRLGKLPQKFPIKKFLEDKGIPKFTQCQDATDSQLLQLCEIGNHFGLYDAVDVISKLLQKGK